MTLIRKLLRNHFRSTLRWRRGVPHPMHCRRLLNLLDKFCSAKTRKCALTRSIIWALFTGNIWSEITEHVCPGCCSSFEDCLEKFIGFAMLALTNCSPPTFDRSRWTGQDLATDWAGLFEGLHRLLTRIYTLFVEVATASAAKKPGAGEGSGVDDHSGKLMILPPIQPVDEAGSSPGHESTTAFSSDDAFKRLQEQNSKSREAVIKGLRSDGPIIDLILYRNAMGTQWEAMKSLLWLGGLGFEEKGEAGIAAAEQSGNSVCPEHCRKYRMLIAAGGDIERKVMKDTRHMLLTEGEWAAIPAHGMTALNAGKAFRMLSCLLCLASEVLERHLAYPFRLFLLLPFPDMAAEISREIAQWDEWTADFIETYGMGGWNSSIFRMALFSQLHIIDKLDTCQMEALHATLRRWLFSCSVQTHKMAVEDASAMDVVRQVHKFSNQFTKEFGEHDNCGIEASAKSSDNVASRKGGGGGAFRAFVSDMSRMEEGKPDFGKLGRLYKVLDAQEKSYYKVMGKAGTKRRSEGEKNTFGPLTKDVSRAEKRMRISNAAAMVPPLFIAPSLMCVWPPVWGI